MDSNFYLRTALLLYDGSIRPIKAKVHRNLCIQIPAVYVSIVGEFLRPLLYLVGSVFGHDKRRTHLGERTSRKERIMPRFLIRALIVALLLIAFTFVNAVVFPRFPTTSTSVTTFVLDLLLIILPVLLISLVAYSLALGIRSIKAPFPSLLLAIVGAFVIGGILALLAFLNSPYAVVHLNINWLGALWYQRLLTLFFVGAPIMLVYLA
jgi:hypothetical protein